MVTKRKIWLQPDGKVNGWCALLRSSGLGFVSDAPTGCPIFRGRTCDNCPAANDPSLGSRYISSSVRFKDFGALCDALEMVFTDSGCVKTARENGYTGPVIVRSTTATNTLVAHGYLGDSRESEIGKVSAFVPRVVVGAGSNDVPIIQHADGSYEVKISAYDTGVLPKRLGWRCEDLDALQGRIKQRVGLGIAMKRLPAQGWRLDVTTLEDGTIEVEASKSSGSTSGQTPGYSPSGWSVQ